MLALIAALNVAVSYGTSAGWVAGARAESTEVLSLQAGWSKGAVEGYLSGVLTGLNALCEYHAYSIGGCISSKVVAAGARITLLTGSVGTLGVAGEIGVGTASASALTGFDRGIARRRGALPRPSRRTTPLVARSQSRSQQSSRYLRASEQQLCRMPRRRSMVSILLRAASAFSGAEAGCGLARHRMIR